jgi:hypothetical protein
MSPDERALAHEEERQRLQDQYRQTHPGATTAGPAEEGNGGGVVSDAVYHSFFTLGTR